MHAWRANRTVQSRDVQFNILHSTARIHIYIKSQQLKIATPGENKANYRPIGLMQVYSFQPFSDTADNTMHRATAVAAKQVIRPISYLYSRVGISSNHKTRRKHICLQQSD